MNTTRVFLDVILLNLEIKPSMYCLFVFVLMILKSRQLINVVKAWHRMSIMKNIIFISIFRLIRKYKIKKQVKRGHRATYEDLMKEKF